MREAEISARAIAAGLALGGAMIAGCVLHQRSRPAPSPAESGDPVTLPAAALKHMTAPTLEPGHPEGGEIDLVSRYPYPLDDIPRIISPVGRVHCPDVELVTYRGDIVRYHKPVTVYVGFRDRLRLFEQIVRDTAIEVYGRPPSRIHHLGSYYCRRIRAWPTYISEHGLGNAIDVAGFDFDWVSAKQAPDTPRKFRRAFKVRLDWHWAATSGTSAVHARFLHLLAERVIARYDLFRVMLGPAEEGHGNHFHFDVAPWRSVNIFEGDEAEEVEEPEAADAPAELLAP